MKVRAPLIAVAALGSLAALALAHVALSRWSTAARCPLGFDATSTPARRRAFAATHASQIHAAARPALDWQLDVTTRDDILSWARDHAVACTRRHFSDLECTRVPAPTLAIDTLWLSFESNRLVALVAFRHTPDPRVASSAFDAIAKTISLSGPPTHHSGDATKLDRALMQASTEWRFSNYWASLRVTNIRREFTLIEEIRALP